MRNPFIHTTPSIEPVRIVRRGAKLYNLQLIRNCGTTTWCYVWREIGKPGRVFTDLDQYIAWGGSDPRQTELFAQK